MDLIHVEKILTISWSSKVDTHHDTCSTREIMSPPPYFMKTFYYLKKNWTEAWSFATPDAHLLQNKRELKINFMNRVWLVHLWD